LWTCIDDTAARLDGWTKGLLEVVKYDPLGYDYVDFLHRTVRDFIEESAEVQEMFSRADESKLEPSGLICHASLAFLKCHPLQYTSPMDWDSVTRIFNYAALVNDDGWRTSRIHAVLDQVGRALKEGPAFVEWNGTVSAGTLCLIAAEYGLKDYIEEILQTWVPAASNTMDEQEFHSVLLLSALRSLRTTLMPERPWQRIPGLVEYLISKGANPNHPLGDGVTGTLWWQFLVFGSRKIRSRDPFFLDMVGQLVAAGADLDAD
jgi:hypothetical protein